VRRAAAAAKINLALVVGPHRDDGKHELVTVYQRVALSDRIAVEHSAELRVTGFVGDTLVRRALELVADGDGTSFAARKRIPVAAGLGGGSSDAATALRLATICAQSRIAASRSRRSRDLGADAVLPRRRAAARHG
jgi:4-diphosphocytidyl-2-C-methyl-D-erythritol kinase